MGRGGTGSEHFKVRPGVGRRRERLLVVNVRGRVVGYLDKITGTTHVAKERDREAFEAALVAFLQSTPVIPRRPPVTPQTLRPPAQPRSARRRSSLGQWRPWLIVGLILVAAGASHALAPAPAASGPEWGSVPPPVSPVVGDPDPLPFPWTSGRPTPVRAASGSPLGQAPVRLPSGPHAFMRRQQSSFEPVAYDPCRPLRYVVNTRTAPPGARALVREAIDIIEAATGLRFMTDGRTDEPPVRNRRPFQPSRYGDRWAPILIAWSDPEELAELRGGFAGMGGSNALFVPEAGAWVYVTGSIALDGPQLDAMLTAENGRAHARAVIVHEAAHLVGLGHVNDPTQLMYEQGNVAALQFGDRAGLGALGRGRCFTEL